MLLIDDKHDDLPNSMVISQFANEKKTGKSIHPRLVVYPA